MLLGWEERPRERQGENTGGLHKSGGATKRIARGAKSTAEVDTACTFGWWGQWTRRWGTPPPIAGKYGPRATPPGETEASSPAVELARARVLERAFFTSCAPAAARRS